MSSCSDKFHEKYDGYRGDLGTRGCWLTLEEASRFCVTKEDWWKTNLVEPIQHDPTGPKDCPIWQFENGDMYLGEWKTGPKGHPVEHGTGITYNHYPYKIRGLIHQGGWKNGHNSGQGESYWLKSCKVWEEDHLPGSPILRPSEETGHNRGIPFCYKGNYDYRNCGVKSDPKAVVTLKDGTTRVGPWKDGFPIGDWFQHPSAATTSASAKDYHSDSSEEERKGQDRRLSKKQNNYSPAMVTPRKRRPRGRTKEDSDANREDEEEEWEPEEQTKSGSKYDKKPSSKKRKRAPAPNRDRQSNSTLQNPARRVAVKQEEPQDDNDEDSPNIICLDDSSDEEESTEEAAPVAVKREEEEDNDQRPLRVQQIRQYLTNEVFGNNPNPTTMTTYAERLYDFGCESVEMIQADLQRRHVEESFHWMKELHKEVFLRKLS